MYNTYLHTWPASAGQLSVNNLLCASYSVQLSWHGTMDTMSPSIHFDCYVICTDLDEDHRPCEN